MYFFQKNGGSAWQGYCTHWYWLLLCPGSNFLKGYLGYIEEYFGYIEGYVRLFFGYLGNLKGTFSGIYFNGYWEHFYGYLVTVCLFREN